MEAEAGESMNQCLVGRVRAAVAESEFLRVVASVRADGGRSFALGADPVRPLRPAEIDRLESQGNWSDDWSRVLVADGFDVRRVRGSYFQGEVILGRFDDPVPFAGGSLPAGVYNSTLADCVVGHNALVREVKLLANYVVGPAAVLFACGRVTCGGKTTFGNAIDLSVGIETGGREVPVYAELDVEVAAAVARPRQAGLVACYREAVAEYRTRAACRRGIVGPGARLENTPHVEDAFVGPHCRVDGATMLADCTLLGNRDEPARVDSGACVRQAVLQWGARVSTLAVVHRALLTEHSHVERHAKVADSILGPNTAVAEGEVTASLLGPFVASHHQALVIATLWPEGRGNVGHGASAGCNHTSRAPDQEFWAGEGMFLGLGVNIKFPSDFSRAPYTVVACGVDLLPQRVTFPFSLLTTPSERHDTVPPAYNEIFPGWVLAENTYALKRNESKFRARNKARRTAFDFAVFRPDTIDLMRDACLRLEDVRPIKDVYTDRDIEGLGKNYLIEASRRKAVRAYHAAIRLYALLGLLARVRTSLADGDQDASGRLLTAPSADPLWEHQRQLLVANLGVPTVRAGLEQLLGMLERVAAGVEQSKAKDDVRGARILDDYVDAHVAAADDPVVRATWAETRQLQAEVEQCLRHLGPDEDAAPRQGPWGMRGRADASRSPNLYVA
jgi:hypothetical protein